MDDPLDLNKVSFIIDNDGNKSAAIIPIDLYQQLIALKALISDQPEPEPSADFSFKVKHVKAWGFPQGKKSKPGFTIVKGSTVSLGNADSLRPSILQLRNKLVDEHVLVKLDDERLQFMRDYAFASPSAAACLVASNARSGLDAWQDHWGRSLKQRGYGQKKGS